MQALWVLPRFGFVLSGLIMCVLSFMFWDIPLQNSFFEPEAKKWWINGSEPVIRIFFYHIPKTFYGLSIAFFILKALFSKRGTKELSCAVMLILSPVLVSLFKIATGIECPKDLLHFGGHQVEMGFFDAMLQGSGRCFPGGHVSAGFGLFALLSYVEKKNRFLCFLGITILGHAMGFYQIARGYHFISHNLATMSISYTLYLLNERFLNRFEDQLDNYLMMVKESFSRVRLSKSL
ncbi:MAG: phosphatase PAP2 family protein [Chlamydiae bacterium]|nr:phosphatase PAP2 family protein [Chlamydiota bacterium]